MDDAGTLNRVHNWSDLLTRARAEVTVREELQKREEEIATAVTNAVRDVSKHATVVRRLEQRAVFAGVYGDWALEEVVPKVLAELSVTPPSGALKIRCGIYDQRHAAIRKVAYPYKPACCTSHGNDVIECVCGDTVVGYLAMNGDYADDLSLDPTFHGRGIAKALICAAAQQIAERSNRPGASKKGMFSLDVRACNLPAISLYKSIGFVQSEKHYPPFYDWHGGYSMKADAAKVAAKMPSGFDVNLRGTSAM
jgi:ribosomal protein S18 acetylase RimI-like enzyme